MGTQGQLQLQATNAFPIVGSDTDPITEEAGNTEGYKICALYTGAGGDIKVKMADGGVVTFAGTAAGQLLPILVTQVFATPTPPTGLLGLVGKV